MINTIGVIIHFCKHLKFNILAISIYGIDILVLPSTYSCLTQTFNCFRLIIFS